MAWIARGCVGLLLTLELISGPAQAAPDEDIGDTPAAAHAFRPPLQPLPDRPRRKLDKATESDRQVLDQVLRALDSPNTASRLVALDAIGNVDESLLPAIRERIDEEAKRADRAAMKRYLLDVREDARAVIKKQMRANGNNAEVETPDYLEMLVKHGSPDAKQYGPLTRVLALSRMCVHLETTSAVRVLLRVFVRFAFLRIDTQLQLKRLGDKALPALIEHTLHPAPNVAQWAQRQLDFFGKAIPSETVQVSDPAILADILRAYGYTRNPDAARLIASFANSENSAVRAGAREAVVLQGEVAQWQLRDTYENSVGRKPPKEWGWERTAQELFREFDTLRLADVYESFERGAKALNNQELDVARIAFNQVLTRAPDFKNVEPLVRAYLAFAEANYAARPEESLDALARAERLSPDEGERKRARSLSLTLEAARLLKEHNVADQTLLTRALDLNPDNEQANALLAEISLEPLVERSSFMRVLLPALLLGVGVLGALLVLWRRPRKLA